jgi:predicted O-methyltransferase YrrM
MSQDFIDMKTHQNYSLQTWEYLRTTGLREDSTKDALESETIALFPSDAEMMAQRQESEFFELILRFAQARKCIEIGVFTGSSSLSIARGIGPSGKLFAFDVSEEFTNVARKYWRMEGLEDRIELSLGDTVAGLNRLMEEGHEGTFDFAFIDADKPGYIRYYDLVVRLLRKGGLLALDNAIWGNAINDPQYNDERTLGLRAVNERVRRDERMKNVILPMADGVNLAVKL